MKTEVMDNIHDPIRRCKGICVCGEAFTEKSVDFLFMPACRDVSVNMKEIEVIMAGIIAKLTCYM